MYYQQHKGNRKSKMKNFLFFKKRLIFHSEILPVIDKSNLTQNEEQERPVTHISIKSLSRPTSTSIKKDFIPSRSNSITIPEQSLYKNIHHFVFFLF